MEMFKKCPEDWGQRSVSRCLRTWFKNMVNREEGKDDLRTLVAIPGGHCIFILLLKLWGRGVCVFFK